MFGLFVVVTIAALASADGDETERYRTGARAWAEAGPAIQAARGKLGMKPDDPGPLPDKHVRKELSKKLRKTIDDGVDALQRAIEDDPWNAEGLANLSLLLNARADLSDSPEKAQMDLMGGAQFAAVARAVNKARDSGQTPPALVVANRKTRLARRVEPEYPAEAKARGVQGKVLYEALIGSDGHVRGLKLISGDPVLVPASEQAVRQWMFEPMSADGHPVEVLAILEVNFVPNY